MPFHAQAHRLSRFFDSESGAGLLLIVIAVAALVLANSPMHQSYHDVFHAVLPWTPVPRLDTPEAWINDGLMALFFFVVGLEIKREVLVGALSSSDRRRLPIVAAVAGMVVPALVYLAFARLETNPIVRQGWAIPAATDIAFAVGVLGLVAKRVPPSLRLFLLTVAIVDDLGAVTIIAVFYTPAIALPWLIGAMVCFAGLVAVNRYGVRTLPPYVLLGLGLWLCLLHSGIHATIAGVLAAFTIPLKGGRRQEGLLQRMEHAIAPWSNFAIVPLFGFANAGVSLHALAPSALLDPMTLGIILGLFLGKQAGIMLALAAARWLRFASLPAGADWLQLWGMAMLCGIGFTMSLFIAPLAFPSHPLLTEEAKLGVLGGTLLSSLAGYALLRFGTRPATTYPVEAQG